jgi:hypothetical protein
LGMETMIVQKPPWTQNLAKSLGIPTKGRNLLFGH